MKTCLLAMLATLPGVSALGQSLVTFDDLVPGSDWVLIEPGYGGLQWFNFGVLNGSLRPVTEGYRNGMVSPSNVAFNLQGDPASIGCPHPFTLDTAYLTAAFVEGMQIQVRGFVGTTPIYDNTYVVSTRAPTLIHFNYAGVDRVTFAPTTGSPFALDDLVVTLPEPRPNVLAWGSQTNVPLEATNVVALAGGYDRSLALRCDGTVVGWRKSGIDTNTPGRLRDVVAIAASSYRNLALQGDGTVVAWGGTATYVPPNVLNIVAIACNPSQNLALKNDGAVLAWMPAASAGWATVVLNLSNVVASRQVTGRTWR